MGIGSKLKKSFTKTFGRGPGALIPGLGKGGALSLWGKGSGMDKALRETGHGVGYLTGANAMQDLIDAQNAANSQIQANAQRQASINAGNVQQESQAGTEDAVSKLLKKRTALQRSIRTSGQQRLGD